MSIFKSSEGEQIRRKIQIILMNVNSTYFVRGHDETSDENYRLDEIIRLANSISRQAADMKEALALNISKRQMSERMGNSNG